MGEKKSEQKLGFMWDIESLDVGPRSVVTQIAFAAFDLQDPDTLLAKESFFLPIQPQLTLGRTVSASTLIWWMKQDDKARLLFEENVGVEYEELAAFLRAVVTKFNRVTRNGVVPYENWAKGPQFDMVNIETLMDQCAINVPWNYDATRDLRTLMKLAGISTSDVERPESMTPHIAFEDVRYQILCYQAAQRNIGRA